jgi:hypothetical protein
MSTNQYFKVPIPSGYRIFFNQMEVSGVGYRKSELAKALSGKQMTLGIEAEPNNKHDKNALKIIAFKKWLFGTKKLHIGYVPKEVAQTIALKNLNKGLLPRLKEIWVGDKGGVKVNIDILGLKSEYHKIENT